LLLVWGSTRQRCGAGDSLVAAKSIEPVLPGGGTRGRDGLSADCVLLWQKKDAGLLGFFCQSNYGRGGAESGVGAVSDYPGVRGVEEVQHRQICTHFGETPKWKGCEACDVAEAWRSGW